MPRCNARNVYESSFILCCKAVLMLTESACILGTALGFYAFFFAIFTYVVIEQLKVGKGGAGGEM